MRGCQHSGVGLSLFSPTDIFLACSGVSKTSLGSSLGAWVSTEPSGASWSPGGAGRWESSPSTALVTQTRDQ